MKDWRLVCPLSRLSIGGAVTAVLDGRLVLVQHAEDGTVRAISNRSGAVHAHDVRVRHGVVEVALPGRVAR